MYVRIDIHGMKCREYKIRTAISVMVCLANWLGEPACLTAKTISNSSVSHQPAPELYVRIYSFAAMPPSLLHEAESEAARLLHSVKIELKWVDCTSLPLPASCMSPRLPTDLIVRFVRKALPQVTTAVLGVTVSSLGDDDGAAFIFYDRIVALRRYARFLPQMLGRVMAHEIAHLLLPQQGHSDFGLMRGQWRADDMDYSSAACLGLPTRSVEFMQKEALRRVSNAHGSVEK